MLALLCGGQGRLSSDMFDLTADQPEAAPIFAAAGALLGADPRDLVRGTVDALQANRTNQLLSVAAALTLHACLAEALAGETAVTGYSVGEMAAWSIAGIWSPATTLHLTDQRARMMDAAGGADGQLGYVRGLNRRVVEGLVAGHGCAIAIINPGNLFVIGGSRGDVTTLCEAAEAAGAIRACLLEVKIASHTDRLSDAAAPFRAVLRSAHPAEPKPDISLLAGGDGARVFRVDTAIDSLAAQISRPIDWAATLEALVEHGVDRVLDLGPGHALADMMSATFPDIRSHAATGFRSVEGIRNWLNAAG